MSTRHDAIYAIITRRGRIRRVVQAPPQEGWEPEEYQALARKLSHAWSQAFWNRVERVFFVTGSELEETRELLGRGGFSRLEAFDDIQEIDFEEFDRILAGKSL